MTNETQECPKCGMLLQPGHVYCSQCGHKILPDRRMYSKAALTAVILLAIFSILGFMAAIFGSMMQGELEGVVENQLKSIRTQQITKAYYEYTSKNFQDATSLEAFRSFLLPLAPFVKNKSITFKGRVIKGDAGVVEATLLAKDGQEINVDYQLTKENGKWKIIGIQVVK